MVFELAAVTESADLLVGLVLGLCVGLLVGPAFRSWLSFREWTEASREAKLADRLLTNLGIDTKEDAHSLPTTHGTRTPSRTEPRTPAWPTSH